MGVPIRPRGVEVNRTHIPFIRHWDRPLFSATIIGYPETAVTVVNSSLGFVVANNV